MAQTALTISSASVDVHCTGDRWVVDDLDFLARIIVIVVMGQATHARDVIKSLALSFIGGLVGRTAKEALTPSQLLEYAPLVSDSLASAIRRGYDSPQKLAFSDIRARLLSRVLIHREYAEKIADTILIGQSDDYRSVKARIRMSLEFAIKL
ncbi:hypothetical protein [Reyranella sp.]|uniref:hypothetical protein n=1 Tax=Reyranella sp. TaxID=1929291 RepID=UPI0027300520|nr:hypothetical protein [Reyranella sp.]MDP2373906.1 hypothetical protein [Reyranella sp.]